MKKIVPLSLVLAACMLANFYSCASTEPAASTAAASVKPVLLVVSFGTSFNENRARTIGAIENALAQKYPDYEMRRAFTSQIVIDHIFERDGEKIDNVQEAMDKLVQDKVTNLVVQSTLVMPGAEYDESMAAIKAYEGNFAKVSYGLPLLISDADFDATANALIANFNQYIAADTALILMGHGTHHNANEVYAKLDALLKSKGAPNFYIATVEGSTLIEDVIAQLNPAVIKNVVLSPFMIVAGDHANNDMAGDEPDSWKSILTARGFQVTTILRGLGEYPEIQTILSNHAGAAMGN